MLEAPAIAALTILVLALFVGVEVISKVPPLLHTPLMSGSNAISGITVVGAILLAGSENNPLELQQKPEQAMQQPKAAEAAAAASAAVASQVIRF